jgi:hypothetical protein
MVLGVMVMAPFVDIHAKAWYGVAWVTSSRILEAASSFCPTW